MTVNIGEYFGEKKVLVETVLCDLVPSVSSKPKSIHEAMRYSLFAGGKRIRPILALAAAEMLGGDEAVVVEPACALELIHTYSLIHDDLPALDNDDLRRGKPTCHIKFGEAIAILAGDALFTHAFRILALYPKLPEYNTAKIKVIELVADAAGTSGMVGGQVADLEAENRTISKEELQSVHDRKTGALITVSLMLGAILSGADDEELHILERVGQLMGTLFQVVDDILDVEGSTAVLGKTVGADATLNKATYPSMWGMKESKNIAHCLNQEVKAYLSHWGERASVMTEISEFILNRQS